MATAALRQSPDAGLFSSRVARIDFHKGKALMKLAEQYATVQEVVAEIVQNGIDTGARHITVKVNWSNQIITVRDDGEGASEAKFDAALISVAHSTKSSDKLGKFGLGLISPLGKCERFYFTSCPRSRNNAYNEWLFDTAKLARQRDELGIQVRPRPDLSFGQGVDWRTEVRLEQFTQDKQISQGLSIPDLRQHLLDKYSIAMVHRKVRVRLIVVHVDGTEETELVSGSTYAGKPLPVIRYQDELGDTTIKLFLVRSKKARLNLKFGELGNDYRFSWTDFSRSSAKNILDQPVFAALQSGTFEGEVLSATASLETRRKSFENNDALYGLCVHLTQWYEEHGKKQLDKSKSDDRAIRNQALGVRALEMFADSLSARTEELAGIADWLRKLPTATAGTHNHQVIGRTQDDTSLAPTGGALGKREAPQKKRKKTEPRENGTTNDAPLFSAAGPKGTHRRVVRNNRMGLQLEYVELEEGSSDLWRFVPEETKIQFNITHPTWVECDDKDWGNRTFQYHAVLAIATLEADPNRDTYSLRKLECQKHLNLLPITIRDCLSTNLPPRLRKSHDNS